MVRLNIKKTYLSKYILSNIFDCVYNVDNIKYS